MVREYTGLNWDEWYTTLAVDMLQKPGVDKESKKEWAKVLIEYLPRVDVTIKAKEV